MQEGKENNKNMLLVPIDSKGLVRLKNSIAITEKILKERTLTFYQHFSGKIYKIVDINQEAYYKLLYKNNETLYLLNIFGNILKIDILNGVVSEIKTLYNYLEKYEENPDDVFYNPKRIIYFLEENKMYISNNTSKIFIYDMNSSILINKELNENIDMSHWIEYDTFLPFKNNLFCFCTEWISKEVGSELLYETKRTIRILKKDSQELVHIFKAIDKFYYFNLIFSQDYVFAINENGINEYKGKILKQSIVDFTHTFIDAFENSWVKYFDVLVDNIIICYSNYVLRLIDSKEKKIIFEIEFEKEINLISISENKIIVALLFNDGEILIYSFENDHLKKINMLHYNEMIGTDYEPVFFSFDSNQLLIGNRKKINIYR
jgi:hypothetical protein